ncbi:MAG: [FeFe] hydrogenase H-cluster radical SAM maturase HydE [Treponema sp.]|nr:[FeFe] hydrogenase H-cluster radical SAM maturase HydE [Treponema sp.]
MNQDLVHGTARHLVDTLKKNGTLSREEFKTLLTTEDNDTQEYLSSCARELATANFGKDVYLRGLIEFSNYCKQNCLYCGLRRDNRDLERYRLTKEEILECCKEGHRLGFRTFVLQSGEDEYYTTKKMVEIIHAIRIEYPDCAITVSVGEKDEDTYRAYYNAGANRFLLRHETISPEHYRKLHPPGMEIETRKECLYRLKDIGFQTGSGIMVGSPFQTVDNIIDDLYFLAELKPEMIGIGPYLPSKDTPFRDQEPGSVELTVRLISIFRLMHPYALIPATTALATIHPTGREKGILAGANVVMPNLSPLRVREKYQLYDNKACTGDEAAHCRGCLQGRLEKIGYTISEQRGDHVSRMAG